MKSHRHTLLGASYRDRGSRKRVQKIRWRRNMSVEFWIFIVGILMIVFLLVPWLMTRPAPPHH